MQKGVVIGLCILLLLTTAAIGTYIPIFSYGGEYGYYDIQSSVIENVQKNSNITLTFNIYNYSGMPPENESMACFFKLYNNSGDKVCEFNNIKNTDFSLDIDGHNFTEAGAYHYTLICNNTEDGGGISKALIVTPSGKSVLGDETYFLVFLLGAFIILGLGLMYLTDNWLQPAFLLLTTLLVPVSLNVVTNLLEELLFPQNIINLFWVLYTISIIGWFALMLYVVWQFTMGLKLRKNPNLMQKSPLKIAKERRGYK